MWQHGKNNCSCLFITACQQNFGKVTFSIIFVSQSVGTGDGTVPYSIPIPVTLLTIQGHSLCPRHIQTCKSWTSPYMEIFKLVYYVARMSVSKWPVGIRLQCLLVLLGCRHVWLLSLVKNGRVPIPFNRNRLAKKLSSVHPLWMQPETCLLSTITVLL